MKLQKTRLQFLIETRQLTAICNLIALRPASIPKILKRRKEQLNASKLQEVAE